MDQNAAESAIFLALEHDRDRIIRWAIRNNAGAPLEVNVADLGGPIGRLAENGAIRDVSGVKVILRADGIGGWLIQTAYPN